MKKKGFLLKFETSALQKTLFRERKDKPHGEKYFQNAHLIRIKELIKFNNKKIDNLIKKWQKI